MGRGHKGLGAHTHCLAGGTDHACGAAVPEEDSCSTMHPPGQINSYIVNIGRPGDAKGMLRRGTTGMGRVRIVACLLEEVSLEMGLGRKKRQGMEGPLTSQASKVDSGQWIYEEGP